jgi:hypothetical protein
MRWRVEGASLGCGARESGRDDAYDEAEREGGSEYSEGSGRGDACEEGAGRGDACGEGGAG